MIEAFEEWGSVFTAPGVCMCVQPVDDHFSCLTTEEQEVVAAAVAIRKNTYSTGRYCAKTALDELGVPLTEFVQGLLRQQDGAVDWPKGTIGSISHTNDWAIAAVAKTDADLQAVGIDIEQIDRVKDNTLRMIATDEEKQHLTELAEVGKISWARVALFSIKESVYKSLRPIYGEFIQFKDVQLHELNRTAEFSKQVEPIAGVEFFSPKVELLLPKLASCCVEDKISVRLAVLPTHVVSFVTYSV